MTYYDAFVGLPVNLDSLRPAVGTSVIFTIGNPKKIHSGVIVKTKNIGGWGVRCEDGKIRFPYQSQLIKPGTILPDIKAKIVIDNNTKCLVLERSIHETNGMRDKQG